MTPATLPRPGAMHVGDFASGLEVTGKNNDLSLSTNMMDVTGKQSTGVTITGDENTIDITGDMVVDQKLCRDEDCW
ncbi:hypothetical protein ABR759_18580 [Escherichia coli]